MKIAQKLLWQNAALIFMAWVRIGVSQQCGSRPDVVFREDGDVMVTVLLDLTHGIYCNQTDPNSSKSMHGLLQTLKTLNSIQFLGSSKIGKHNKSLPCALRKRSPFPLVLIFRVELSYNLSVLFLSHAIL